MLRITVFGFASLILMPASAETVISCGGTFGKAYYFPNTLLESSEAGWTDDALSNGAIALAREGEIFDILVKDALGMISARSQGAEVNVLDAHQSFVTVLVNYLGGSKEIYTFDFEQNRVTWSQHKFGVLFDKAHTMIGDCD